MKWFVTDGGELGWDDAIKPGDIDQSIEKWKFLARKSTLREIGEPNYVASCALCQAYIGRGCFGCPVFHYGKAVLGENTSYCNETPYVEFQDYLEDRGYDLQDEELDKAAKLARKEVAFLEKVKKYWEAAAELPEDE